MSFFTRLKKFDPDQPRDSDGKWTSSGSTSASAAGGEGDMFVSPSVASHLNFGQAVAGLHDERQGALLQASATINHELRLDAEDKSVVGAWSDGAENTVMTVVHHASMDQIRTAAAMKAHLADQKQALIFKEQPSGTSVLFDFDAKGDLATIHKGLLDDGVAFHTLVPSAGGAKVYVCDLDGSAVDAVAKGAKRYGATVHFVRGNAQFLGTEKQDGTDREIRNDARGQYEREIAGSRLQGASAVWDRIHSTYGENLKAKAA